MDVIPLIQRIVAILWPSFLVAGIATIIFTTAFDPVLFFDNHGIGRLSLYSICFFLFWFFGATTAALTCYFLKPCSMVRKTCTKPDAAEQESKTVAEKTVASMQ